MIVEVQYVQEWNYRKIDNSEVTEWGPDLCPFTFNTKHIVWMRRYETHGYKYVEVCLMDWRNVFVLAMTYEEAKKKFKLPL